MWKFIPRSEEAIEIYESILLEQRPKEMRISRPVESVEHPIEFTELLGQ